MRPIRMVVISSNALTRSGITQIVAQSRPPIEIAGTFPDFMAAHRYLDCNPVDVILVDEAIPRHANLVQEVRTLCSQHIGVAVVVILQRPTASLVDQVLGHGARGILDKNEDLGNCLVQAIVWGKQRGIYLSPGVSHLVDIQRNSSARMKQRDIDVLKLLADGVEAREIASQIGVGYHTIYRILRSLRGKFNAQNNAHLIAITHHSKLFETDGVD